VKLSLLGEDGKPGLHCGNEEIPPFGLMVVYLNCIWMDGWDRYFFYMDGIDIGTA